MAGVLAPELGADPEGCEDVESVVLGPDFGGARYAAARTTTMRTTTTPVLPPVERPALAGFMRTAGFF